MNSADLRSNCGGAAAVCQCLGACDSRQKAKPKRLKPLLWSGWRIAYPIEAVVKRQISAKAFGPKGQPLTRKAAPVKARAGIFLAVRGHVGMGNDSAGWNVPPVLYLGKQCLQRLHLWLWKGLCTGICQLYPDGMGIDIGAALP